MMVSVASGVVIIPLLISVILLHSCDGFTTDHAERTHLYRRGCDNTMLYGVLDQEDFSGGVVSVNIKRDLPNVTPLEARDAWIEYHWKKGAIGVEERCTRRYE